MPRWLKSLLFGIWGLLLLPLIGITVERWFVENIFSEPNALATDISNSLVALSRLRWFNFALAFMTGMVVAMLLESSVHKAGARRAFELRSLGYKFRSLSESIKTRTTAGWPDNAADLKQAIAAALTSAKTFGLWVPDQRVYELPDATFLCEYFRSLGVLLEDGRLDEARREAVSWRPFLDRARGS